VVENKKNAALRMVYTVKNLITVSYVILNIQINKIMMRDLKKLMRTGECRHDAVLNSQHRI